MNEETDLVRRSQGGDLDAFNALVRTYQAHAYNLALRMLGNESMAADAAQEAFISAFRAIGGFRGGDFRSWILRITANSCRDLMRSSKARPSVSLEALELTPEGTPRSRRRVP